MKNDKDINFRITNVKCCYTCVKAAHSIYGVVCPEYIGNNMLISPAGICDYYSKRYMIDCEDILFWDEVERDFNFSVH